MAKANVNIENVDSFRQGIESQRDSVIDSVDTYNATIDETKESLTVEKEKTVTLIGEVQSTLSVLLSKIEEQRAKVEELQASLAALEASEPEEYETVYEPDVTDDEGNVISEGGSYEVETAAHIAWRNEVDKLSSELANEEDRLALMEEVESKLQAVASKLEEQQVKLDELYAELEGGQEEVNARRGEIESFSGSAIEKLNKISSVLQEYLAASIRSCVNSLHVNSVVRRGIATGIRKLSTPRFTYSGAGGARKLYEDELYAEIITNPASRKLVDEILNDKISNEWGVGRRNAYLTLDTGETVNNNHLIFHHLVKLRSDPNRFVDLAQLLGRPRDYYDASLIGAKRLTADVNEVMSKALEQGNHFRAIDGKDWYLYEGDDNSAVVIIKDDKKETVYCNNRAARTFNLQKTRNAMS